MNGVRQTTAVVMTFRKHNKNSLERREGPYRSSTEKNTMYVYLRHILYPVKLQPDNNLFCTLCATPHSLQAIIMIDPEIHFFTIQYLIHPISILNINNYWLFCYAPPTYFVPCRPSSERSFTRNIYIYIYIYIYICVCVCVCILEICEGYEKRW